MLFRFILSVHVIPSNPPLQLLLQVQPPSWAKLLCRLDELGRHPGGDGLPNRIRRILLHEVPASAAVDGCEVWQRFLNPLRHVLVYGHPRAEFEEELRLLRAREPLGEPHLRC